MAMAELDSKDKEILNLIQWDFPLVERPFAEIGKRLNISEDEALTRIKAIKDTGIVRQINAIFDTRRLNYKSALVAMSIKPENLEDVANEVNKHPGVSHNYERNHEYNLWFTIAVPPDGAIQHDPDNPEPTDKPKNVDKIPFSASERDKDFIRELQKDVEIVTEPFAEPARRLGISVEELFVQAKEYERIGVMRRFAAILRHRDAGFLANGMIVWKVPEEKIDETGAKLAEFPQVSHCYRRPIYPDWPYNLFSMVHARSEEAAKKMGVEMSKIIGITDYRILFSSREFKKDRVKYFEENYQQVIQN